jgi:hypothetical protein
MSSSPVYDHADLKKLGDTSECKNHLHGEGVRPVGHHIGGLVHRGPAVAGSKRTDQDPVGGKRVTQF